MSNLQKFVRLKSLLIRILIFTTLFSQLIMSQETKKTLKNNALKGFDLSNPFNICWKLKNEGSIYNLVASDKTSNSLVATNGGIIKSISSESGKKRWETDLGGEIVSAPYFDGENIYIVSQSKVNQDEVSTDEEKNTIIRSLSISSGITIWQANLKTSLNPEQIFLYVYESTLLVTDKNGNLQSINKNDGILSWQKTLEVKLSTPPYFYADKAILGISEKQLIILRLSDGKLYKKIELSGIPTAISYNISDETLIIGDQKGIVSSITLNFESSKKEKKTENVNWKFRLGAEVSNVSFTSRGLLITSLDNFAYLISLEKGNLIWKKRLAGRISEKSLVLDDYALLTTIAEPIISVVELRSSKLVNKIILEDENFVTASPIRAHNKIVVTTSKGLYAFSPNECLKIEK